MPLSLQSLVLFVVVVGPLSYLLASSLSSLFSTSFRAADALLLVPCRKSSALSESVLVSIVTPMLHSLSSIF